ncbi:hypothetical protein BH23CHL4_BH23CHL4_01610 [soil metagenome]
MSNSEQSGAVFQPQWLSRDSAIPIEPFPGISMWPVIGDRIMLNLVRLPPGALLPDHFHPNEQAGTVVEGELILTIAGKSRSLHSGDAYVIPPNIPHSGQAGPGGCDVIDVFSPPRDDYRVAGHEQPW